MLRAAADVRSRGGLPYEMTVERTYNVLFLCTGNSARSIIAESLLNHWGNGKFRAFSAGSFPKGSVHPLATELLRRTILPTENLRRGIADPAAVEGAETERALAFRRAFSELETRIKLFVNLPIDSLDGMTLQARLRQIGRSTPTGST